MNKKFACLLGMTFTDEEILDLIIFALMRSEKKRKNE